MDELKIDELHERHPGLTPALSGCYREAACVCLARHHSPPVTVTVQHNGDSHCRSLSFLIPDERTLKAHANEIDATEAGAYGVSLAAVETVAGFVAVRRAETLTGADWYVVPKGVEADDLEACVRLEVSGTNAGSSGDLKRLLLNKVAQTTRGQSNLPAMATVVGFKILEVAISPLGELR